MLQKDTPINKFAAANGFIFVHCCSVCVTRSFGWNGPVLGGLARLDHHNFSMERAVDLHFGIGSIRILPFEYHRTATSRCDALRWVHTLFKIAIGQTDG